MAAELTNSTFDFKTYSQARRALIEKCLRSYLEAGEPKLLWESMRYSVLSGGKRLRALLCLAGAEAVSDDEQAITNSLPCACAIELIHAMSLIHDDLPAMDNDDFRRGKPTNHKVFGEAMALLAGDALLVYATEVLLEKTSARVDTQRLIRTTIELARATGAIGMVGGQVEDLTFTGARGGQLLNDIEFKVTPQIVESIHRKKTGALIRFSLWSGACLAGGSDEQLQGLSSFGELLGLAFQITDDLLDVTGDIATLGKTPGKDEAALKATWIRVFGVEGARTRLEEMEKQGEALLRSIPLQQRGAAALTALLKYAIHRVN